MAAGRLPENGIPARSTPPENGKKGAGFKNLSAYWRISSVVSQTSFASRRTSSLSFNLVLQPQRGAIASKG